MSTRVVGVISLMGAALVAAAGCGDGTGPATSRNDPGTGTSTLQVIADIDANDQTGGGFITDFGVSVQDGLGNRVSGASVTIRNATLGTVTLTEAASGTYFAQRNSFPSGDFRLDVVSGSNNVSGVILGGPGVHNITAPLQNAIVPAGQPLPVRWTVPSQAQAAEVETQDFAPVTVPDNGSYTISGANNPANANQRIRVFRFNEVTMAGALPGSRLQVEVRKTVEPVIVQ